VESSDDIAQRGRRYGPGGAGMVLWKIVGAQVGVDDCGRRALAPVGM
jgi:hypothetical protein